MPSNKGGGNRSERAPQRVAVTFKMFDDFQE
jgi:hypothetical protein